MTPDRVRILVPSGMLGSGFPPEIVDRGLELGADVIAGGEGAHSAEPLRLRQPGDSGPEQARCS